MLVEACDSCKVLNLEQPLVPVTIVKAKQHFSLDGDGKTLLEHGPTEKIIGLVIGPIGEGVLGHFAKPQRYCAKCLKKNMEETTKALIANLEEGPQPQLSPMRMKKV